MKFYYICALQYCILIYLDVVLFVFPSHPYPQYKTQHNQGYDSTKDRSIVDDVEFIKHRAKINGIRWNVES